MTNADPFDSNMAAWLREQHEPWGRLRYWIELANLRRHLPTGPLHILDAGGGNGLLSLALAAEGCHITLVDFSKEMLTEARRAAQEQGVADRVEIVEADLSALPELFREPRFDVVFCHNVLQYVSDMPATVLTVAGPLRSGGLLSLISVNRYSETYRDALLWHNLDAAHAKLDAATVQAGLFGVDVSRYTAADMEAPLRAAGCAVIADYGVRCLSDYLPNELKHDPVSMARLETLELDLSGRFPYKLLARFFHVVARKNVQ